MLKNSTKLKRDSVYNESSSGLMFLLALFVPSLLMFFVLLVCGGIWGKDFTTTHKTFYFVLCFLIPQMGMLASFFFVSERKKVNYAKANQINFKINIWVLAIVVVIGIVCMYGFTPLINWFDHVVEGWGYKTSMDNEMIYSLINSPLKLIAGLLYIALLPAIVEELTFRGVITNGLKKQGIVTQIALSAVMFALMHQNLQQLIYQLFLGAIMAYIAVRCGSIIYTMILHFMNNAVILIVSYASKNATTIVDYSNAWNVISPFVFAILAIGIVIGLLFLIDFILKKSDAKQKQNELDGVTQSAQFAETETNSTANMKKNNTEIVANLTAFENTSAKSDDENSSKQNVVKEKNGAKEQTEKTSQTDKPIPFWKNPFMATAMVAGVLMWIVTVVSNFKWYFGCIFLV